MPNGSVRNEIINDADQRSREKYNCSDAESPEGQSRRWIFRFKHRPDGGECTDAQDAEDCGECGSGRAEESEQSGNGDEDHCEELVVVHEFDGCFHEFYKCVHNNK